MRTFCGLLAYSGCRISEALAVTADRVDLAAGLVVLESLKKRRAGVYRAVPLPPTFLDALDLAHGLRKAQRRADGGKGLPLWPWSRMTAWRRVAEVMVAAGVNGSHATPKGMRHGFGDAAVPAGIPLNLAQRWMGHAQLSTTAIYAEAVGAASQAGCGDVSGLRELPHKGGYRGDNGFNFPPQPRKAAKISDSQAL